MDVDKIENMIVNSKKYRHCNSTMFGINLGLELNKRLTSYANKHGVSKASILKNLLIAYLDEKERDND